MLWCSRDFDVGEGRSGLVFNDNVVTERFEYESKLGLC